MAKVLFSITDAQLRCLEQLRVVPVDLADTDQRTLTGLRRRGLVERAEGSDTLTAQGQAVLSLCERLAITSGKKSGKGTR